MEMGNERKRDGGIAAPEWWTTDARARRKNQRLRIEDVAEMAAKRMGLDEIDPSRISRCLDGTTSTIPLLEAISAVLGMAPPVFVAASAPEARELASVQQAARERERLLVEADRRIATIKKNVTSDRQGHRVRSSDGADEETGGGGARREHRGDAAAALRAARLGRLGGQLDRGVVR